MPKTKETSAKSCTCSFQEMEPERICFDNIYTHKCLHCGGRVTEAQNKAYNRFYGFSGFDEKPADFE